VTLQSGPDEQVGVELLRLLTEPQLWVYRRVETIRFAREGEARRHVSVDFIVPPPLLLSVDPRTGRSLPSRGKKANLIPLSLLHKKPLALLDVVTDEGRSTPVLDTIENGFLAWSVLAAAARSALGWSSRRSLPSDLLDLIQTVAREPIPAANEALAALSRSTNVDIRLLSQKPGFRKITHDLASNFILLVEGSPGTQGQRRIVKYSYAVDFSETGLRSVGPWKRPHVRQFAAQLPTVASSASYHIQVVPPEGALVADTTLLVADSISGEVNTNRWPRVGGIANANVNNLPWGSSAEARVDLALSHTGILTAALLATGAIAVLTAALAALSFWKGSAVSSLHSEGDATLAALLAIPGLVAGYLARGGESSLVARLLRPVRALLLTASATMYVAAVTIVIGPPSSVQRWILLGVFVVGSLAFAAILRWWLGCRGVARDEQGEQ
jgi:hypothetical protein